jgi:hypothetical protein
MGKNSNKGFVYKYLLDNLIEVFLTDVRVGGHIFNVLSLK